MSPGKGGNGTPIVSWITSMMHSMHIYSMMHQYYVLVVVDHESWTKTSHILRLCLHPHHLHHQPFQQRLGFLTLIFGLYGILQPYMGLVLELFIQEYHPFPKMVPDCV